jgi:hypothetical protein
MPQKNKLLIYNGIQKRPDRPGLYENQKIKNGTPNKSKLPNPSKWNPHHPPT